jgi:hypothetical protein
MCRVERHVYPRTVVSCLDFLLLVSPSWNLRLFLQYITTNCNLGKIYFKLFIQQSLPFFLNAACLAEKHIPHLLKDQLLCNLCDTEFLPLCDTMLYGVTMWYHVIWCNCDTMFYVVPCSMVHLCDTMLCCCLTPTLQFFSHIMARTS